MGIVLADAAGRSHDALRRAPPTIKTGSFLTTATGVLAVVTTVVGPWLDALFVLLPSLFRFLFGDSAPSREAQEQERREKLTMQIRSSVASSVASELRPQIAADYAEIAQQMLSTVGQEVEAKVGRIRADINKSQAEVEAHGEEIEPNGGRIQPRPRRGGVGRVRPRDQSERAHTRLAEDTRPAGGVGETGRVPEGEVPAIHQWLRPRSERVARRGLTACTAWHRTGRVSQSVTPSDRSSEQRTSSG